MVEGVGFEPTLSDSQSEVLPATPALSEWLLVFFLLSTGVCCGSFISKRLKLQVFTFCQSEVNGMDQSAIAAAEFEAFAVDSDPFAFFEDFVLQKLYPFSSRL